MVEYFETDSLKNGVNLKVRQLYLSILFLLIGGCASSFQGMKIRAHAPSMEETFRKLSLALTADGYELERVDPKDSFIETRWRPLKENEKPSTASMNRNEPEQQVKITVELKRRGSMYDISLTPIVRLSSNEEVEVSMNSPIRDKWKRILNTLVQKESKEED